jgi:hypothetical protein
MAALALVIAAACSGDPPNNTTCSGALYDPCASEHECQNGACMPFGTFEACTMACTTDSDCPKQDGKTVTCNASKLCEPAAANACEMP